MICSMISWSIVIASRNANVWLSAAMRSSSMNFSLGNRVSSLFASLASCPNSAHQDSASAAEFC